MDEEMLHRVNYFTAECMKINGIGSLRGQMMVQLCALFGLVPLHFYTYLPIHLNGGPGHFMKDGMNWGKGNRKSNLLRWNADIKGVFGDILRYWRKYVRNQRFSLKSVFLGPSWRFADDLFFPPILEKNYLLC